MVGAVGIGGRSSQSTRRLLRAWQRRCASRDVPVWIVLSRIGDELLDEPTRKGRQKALGVPRDHPPTPDRHAAIGQWNAKNLSTREQYAGGNDGDAIAACRQGNERLRGGAF